MEGSIQLTKRQVAFLMSRFDTDSPEEAVDAFIEFLVAEGHNPMRMHEHLARMMAKENN